MGGGGLRILPHKTWNVYGYEQRKKVEEDELREKKRLQKLGDKEARGNVKNALKMLQNEENGTSISKSSSPERKTAKERKEWFKKSKKDEEKLKFDQGSEFTFSKMLKKRMTPWYSKDKGQAQNDRRGKFIESSSDEEPVKYANTKMDKISAFLKESKQRKKDKKKKSKKSKKKKSKKEKKDKKEKIDLKELRKRKMDRERKEKYREAKLLKK